MPGLGESSSGTFSPVPPFDFVDGGGKDALRRVRVLSCGMEEGQTMKRVKQEFAPSPLDTLPKPATTVFAPMPLSMRPVNPIQPSLNLNSLSSIRSVMSSSKFRPIGSPLPFMVKLVESSSQTAVFPEAPLLPLGKDDAKVEDNEYRQFWKAGDYDGLIERSISFTADIDRVRVHPKFLHSNATSHKWALGALAELLDNSMDEVCNGATFVNIDVLVNPKDQTKMLLVEDNGGGMDPDKMRQCMSLGYSTKSKSSNMIGQYGNGFKTSTMRLGSDVIVFSRCQGRDGMSPTQSIGMLSYTFLRSTRKQEIIVPMVDYEKRGDDWHQMERLSSIAWTANVDSIVRWSPYSSETDLLQQFYNMSDQGTRIIIFNLWEDDEGQLELDFVTDAQDIQIRGVNRDEKKIEMSKRFPNSKHFLTYHHSLRSYASILYLRLPEGFRMILRNKEIEHHNIVNDMMIKEEKTYRPQLTLGGVPKDPNIYAAVSIGFVKDATNHIDVQGFNVYHKNRLIKPFWRIWNAAGSDGRGVIGVLEANFIEPAHDKQGFERTTLLNRLEARLLCIQKAYWSSNCHKIGYAPRSHKKPLSNSEEIYPEDYKQTSTTDPSKDIFQIVIQPQNSARHQNSARISLHASYDAREDRCTVKSEKSQNDDYEKPLGASDTSLDPPRSCISMSPGKISLFGSKEAACPSFLSSYSLNDDELLQSHTSAGRQTKHTSTFKSCSEKMGVSSNTVGLTSQDLNIHTFALINENKNLKEREGKLLHELMIEREKNRVLNDRVQVMEKMMKTAADKEEEYVEDRERRDAEENNEWSALR